MAEHEDKRIRRTKRLLRQALTKLLQQKDFQSITVSDVVREADVNRGTFYAHYRDVYDLREKIESGMIEDFQGMIQELRPHEPQALRQVLVRAVDYLDENREAVAVLMRVSGPDGFARKLIGIIESYRLQMQPSCTTEDSYVARFISTGLVGMLEKWITESGPLPKRELIELMARLIPALPSA